MGYRFTLEAANTVANLTFGKVMSCYRDIYSLEESYYSFMYFLDEFHKIYIQMRTNAICIVSDGYEKCYIDMKIINALLMMYSMMIRCFYCIGMR